MKMNCITLHFDNDTSFSLGLGTGGRTVET